MAINARRAGMPILRIVATLFIVALSGSAGIAADASANTDQLLTQSTRNGPVELTVTLDRPTAQIAEPLTLTLTAQAPDGVTVAFPQQPATLGTFTVVHVTDALDIPTDSGRQWIRRYQLESLVAGKQTIPPIAVAFTDRRNATPVSDSIQSPSLLATITSVLEGQTDPLKFRDIKDVVDLPVHTQPSRAWIVWSLGGALVLACAGVALLVWPQRQRQLSAERWALAELQRLEQSDLVAAGQMQLFYFRLTDIVRQYIERQFGIAAPKLTTAEFLDQATRHDTLDEPQRALLRDFLSLADLVKFARFEPGTDDARQAIAKARHFIEQSTGRMDIPVRQEESEAPAGPPIRTDKNVQLATTDKNDQITTTDKHVPRITTDKNVHPASGEKA